MCWIYLKICTLPHCCTLPHRWTAAHCCAHCRTSVHRRAHYRTAGHGRVFCRTLLLHTAWIRMPHTAHRILHTAHSGTPQLTWIRINLCEYVYIYMDSCELMWINKNSCQSKQFHVRVPGFTWIWTWFYFKLFDLFWIKTNLYGSVQICMCWIYLKICSLPDCCTLPHRWTAAHCRTAGQPYTAAHTATLLHCRTQP
jgi:hypothetical protein